MISSDRFVLTVKHTKTIQFQQRTLRYLMTRLDPGDVCCPTTQLAIYMCATPGLQPDEPLFQAREVHEPTGTVFYRPLRYDTFLAKFKSLIRALGLDPDAYAGHSFRRGGATFARDAGLGDELIMAMGDWYGRRSDAWLAYISATQRLRVQAADLLARAVQHAETAPPLLDLDE